MTNFNKEQTIFNLKLSELNMMIVKDRRLVRITGKVDPLNKHNDGKQLAIFSEEMIDSIEPNEMLIHNKIEFANLSDVFSMTMNNDVKNKRFECLVDLSYLDEFNQNDLNPHHDLIQFYGYKDSSSTLDECKFRALYFRVVKRTSLGKYYTAIQIQNSFINEKISKTPSEDYF